MNTVADRSPEESCSIADSTYAQLGLLGVTGVIIGGVAGTIATVGIVVNLPGSGFTTRSTGRYSGAPEEGPTSIAVNLMRMGWPPLTT